MIRLRKKRRWGADHIGYEIGLAASTVQNILNRAGIGRLDRGDRATHKAKPCRYQRDLPGELIHVDIKKIAGIPDGGGWRLHGRGYQGEKATIAGRAGYRYIHTAIDDRTRIAYSEILNDDRAITAAGFWTRAAAWYQSIGISPQRVLTDNGGCYKSGLWHRAVPPPAPKRKRPDLAAPKPTARSNAFTASCSRNGPYIRPWTSDTQRTLALHRVHPLLQSPPSPRITRMGHPHQHPQGQPPQRAHLGEYSYTSSTPSASSKRAKRALRSSISARSSSNSPAATADTGGTGAVVGTTNSASSTRSSPVPRSLSNSR